MLARTNRRGRRVAVSTFALSVVALAGAGVWSRDALRERWYLYWLRSSSAERRVMAARELGAMGSLRAFPEILAAARTKGWIVQNDGVIVSFN